MASTRSNEAGRKPRPPSALTIGRRVPFRRACTRDAAVASGSMSEATTGEAPRREAATARMPVPAPRSSVRPRGGGRRAPRAPSGRAGSSRGCPFRRRGRDRRRARRPRLAGRAERWAGREDSGAARDHSDMRDRGWAAPRRGPRGSGRPGTRGSPRGSARPSRPAGSRPARSRTREAAPAARRRRSCRGSRRGARVVGSTRGPHLDPQGAGVPQQRRGPLLRGAADSHAKRAHGLASAFRRMIQPIRSFIRSRSDLSLSFRSGTGSVFASWSKSFRCSAVRCFGITTRTSTWRSPRPRAPSWGNALASDAEHGAGLGALGEVELRRSPRRVSGPRSWHRASPGGRSPASRSRDWFRPA